MMKSTFKLGLALIILLYSALTYAQKTTNFLINEELFELPGKWTTIGLLKNSGQYHFANKKEGISLFISVRKPEKFEFYKDGLSEYDLLNRYYKWEYYYWNLPTGLKSEVSEIIRSEEKKYIIWKIVLKNSPENNNKDKLSFLLYAVRNNKLLSVSVTAGIARKNEFTESEATEYLKKIYTNLK